VNRLTEDEIRLLLLTPALAGIHSALPRLAWASMHGDRAALEDMQALLMAMPARQASRVWGLLWFHSAGCVIGAPRCESCGAPTDGKGNCFICDRPHTIPFRSEP
jgi:hypothetical protein